MCFSSIPIIGVDRCSNYIAEQLIVVWTYLWDLFRWSCLMVKKRDDVGLCGIVYELKFSKNTLKKSQFFAKQQAVDSNFVKKEQPPIGIPQVP